MLKENFRKYLIKCGLYSSPDFIIVGAQKAGTSALFSILNQHSQITGAHRKEINYFDQDRIYNNDNNYNHYYSFFPLPMNVRSNHLVFEATPEYLYHPYCAKRIFKFNPSIKIIAILREPATRAYSAWRMYHNFKNHPEYSHLYEPRSFRQVIDEETKQIEQANWYNNPIGYVKRGIYSEQLKAYIDQFPNKQLFIIEYKHLIEHYFKILKEIFEFLEINYESLPNQELNKGKGGETVYSEEIQFLRSFYERYNEKLYSLLGRRFEW